MFDAHNAQAILPFANADYSVRIEYDRAIMRAVRSELVVGLSTGVLEGSGGRLDGIGVYTDALGRALRAEGVTVRAVASPRRTGWRLRRPLSADVAFPLPLSWLAAAGSALRAATPLSTSVGRRVDIYHATDYLIPRLRRTPVVATLYDAIPVAHPEYANRRLRGLKNRLLRSWVQAADTVIAISHSAVPDLIEHYRIPRERIRVVPLGVDADWFLPPAEDRVDHALARRGLNRGYFLHVGTLQPRKNLDRLITAYERLPDAERAQRQLVLVGQYGWGAETLVERLNALRRAGRVVWVEYVDRGDLHALYAGAGAFVFPSLAEGFGLPVLEALATGLPVIASDLPVLREIGGSVLHFVVPHDVEALTAAMVGVASKLPSADLVASRRAHALRYDWQSCATRTIDVYRELLSG